MGVELDQPQGKNDGSVDGTRYFTCKPNHGLFTASSKVKRCATTYCMVGNFVGLNFRGLGSSDDFVGLYFCDG